MSENGIETARHIFGHDAHTSVRVLTDAAGALAQLYAYDAYGVMHGVYNPNATFLGAGAGLAFKSLLYSGDSWDPHVQMQYLRARWYQPQTGRLDRLGVSEEQSSDIATAA